MEGLLGIHCCCLVLIGDGGVDGDMLQLFGFDWVLRGYWGCAAVVWF